MRRAFTCLLLWVSLFLPGLTLAHTATTSSLVLDVEPSHVSVTLELPEDQLRLALSPDLGDRPLKTLVEEASSLQNYLLSHFSATDPQGNAFGIELREMRFIEANPVNFLRIKLRLTPAPGTSVRQFNLHDDVILHQVVTHKTLVTLHSDFVRGLLPDEARPLGWIRFQHPDMPVNLAQGSVWAGFGAMVMAGFNHILEGTDHLLFLLAVILPIPLLARAGRWVSGRSLHGQLFKALKLVTAFTLGHSLTLALSSLQWVQPPSQPIEALVAATILISCIQVVRPILPKDWIITAAFGCIHGFAFAETLSNLHYSPGVFALTLFGFNLGIERKRLINPT